MKTMKNVLVCEDDPVQLKLLTALIDQAGYRSLPARSPGEALVAARRCGVDAVLSDVQLVDGNAFDLVGDLRRFGFDAPVLMASAYATEGMKERARRAGAMHFFEKPFDLRKIKESVDAAIKSVKKLDAGVLIVDGHSKVRAELDQAATGAGFDAFTAENGAQALEILAGRAGEIQLLLADLHAFGGEQIRKALEIAPKLHVIMMSGDASRDEIHAGYDAGAAALIRKPVAADRIGSFLAQSCKAASTGLSRVAEPRRSKTWIWALAMTAASLLIGVGSAFGLQNVYQAWDRYEAKADHAMQTMARRMSSARAADAFGQGLALEQIQLQRQSNDATRRYYEGHLEELRRQNRSRSDMPEYAPDRGAWLGR